MPTPDRRSSYDVVVLGAGLAGHSAALAAAERGAEVLMVEKQAGFGGSTVLSGGFFAFADTPLQRSLGLEDDPDLLVRDLGATGGGYADPALLRAYGDGQRALYDWFAAKGVTFADVELGAGQSVPRSHRTDPARLMQTLNDEVNQTDAITYATHARAERLIRGANAAPGVRLADGDGDGDREREVEARGGVVVATGGFSRSEELLRTFAPGQSRAVRIGGAGSVGDGLRMAWHLGADLRDMGQIKGTFGAHPDSGAERHELLLLFYLGAVIVNRNGARYVDESIPYKAIGDACLAQSEALSWQVLDDAIFTAAPQGVPLFDPRPALDRGLLVSAPTLEELAERCGIDATGFVATIARYNEGVKAGRDPEFGRDGLSNHVGALVPIAEPPFYAYPSTTALLATYCGLAVDPEARVIDVFGQAIEGLYAAGEVMGGFHGAAYMTGSSLGKAALFGRIAGSNAARRAGG